MINSLSPFGGEKRRERAKRQSLVGKGGGNNNLETERALTHSFTFVIFFSSGWKTSHLRVEFAYSRRLSQSHTKTPSR